MFSTMDLLRRSMLSAYYACEVVGPEGGDQRDTALLPRGLESDIYSVTTERRV